ncbi:unnamed protein product, partial [Urochloa humidicola]
WPEDEEKGGGGRIRSPAPGGSVCTEYSSRWLSIGEEKQASSRYGLRWASLPGLLCSPREKIDARLQPAVRESDCSRSESAQTSLPPSEDESESRTQSLQSGNSPIPPQTPPGCIRRRPGAHSPSTNRPSSDAQSDLASTRRRLFDHRDNLFSRVRHHRRPHRQVQQFKAEIVRGFSHGERGSAAEGGGVLLFPVRFR